MKTGPSQIPLENFEGKIQLEIPRTYIMRRFGLVSSESE